MNEWIIIHDSRLQGHGSKFMWYSAHLTMFYTRNYLGNATNEQ